MSDLVELTREMLIAESVGLISTDQLTNWADSKRLGSKNPPHFLAAISRGESVCQYEERLDLTKNPIAEIDCYQTIKRASALYEKGRVDLKTLSITCEVLGRCFEYGELAGSLLWLSSEIDLCLCGISKLNRSVAGIQQELYKCIDHTVLPNNQEDLAEVVTAG